MSLTDQLTELEAAHAALDAQFEAHPVRRELVALQQRHGQLTAKVQRLETQLASYEGELKTPATRRAQAFSVPLIVGLSGAVTLLLTFVLGFMQAPQLVTAFSLALFAAGLTGYFHGR